MAENAPNQFHFELVSPARKLMEEPAFQVTIPGEAGDIGVRKGHASLVISVRPGVVEVLREKDAAPEKLFVAGGLADVTAENCTLLAEQALPLSELDGEKLQQERSNLQEDMNAAKDDIERARFARKLTIVDAKLRALRHL